MNARVLTDSVRNWQAVFDEQERKEIEWARLYAAQFNHRTPGASRLALLSKLAGLLDKLESADLTPGLPYADAWGLPVTGDPVRWYIAQGHHSRHSGDDWNLKTGGDSDRGQPVVSVSSGVVVYAGPGSGKWGNLVIVAYLERDGRLTWWRYAHLDKTFVQVSDLVGTGDALGTIGKGGGNAYSAHLHLDARQGGLFDPSEWLRNRALWFDPLPFLLARGVTEVDAVEKRF